jgi:Spy/CpxP family protein refolding chaperone
MTRAIIFVALALALSAGVASAQHAQPYAGMQARPLKALSAEQIADLKAGRGMGLALAAELNGYPGPTHVLELAREIKLTDAQRAHVEALFAAMKAEAIPLGEDLIARESELDRQFAARVITPASLAAAVDAIGATQAKLRTAHLKYHLSTLDVLTPAQVQRYTQLRGYAAAAPAGHSPQMHQQQKQK